ncbi:hypothetical protein BIW11_01761, partial [Tropilaelaps mercedesae]
METYATASERCRRVGGSLPIRTPMHLGCLARFFNDTGQPELTLYFSVGEKTNLRKHLNEVDRVWFLHDNKKKQHRKWVSSDDKRQVVCAIPVPETVGRCNHSAIVHYDLLSFVDAQSRCGGYNSKLPSRETKDEVQCFKGHFPDINLTWLEDRRPDLFGTLSGERCSLNNPAEKEQCPKELRFVCILREWKPDRWLPPISINDGQVVVATMENPNNRLVTIANEGSQMSHEQTLVAHFEQIQQPFYSNAVPLRSPDGDYIVHHSKGSAAQAVNICFNRTGPKLKLLDREHPKDFYLKLVSSLLPDLQKNLSTDQQGHEFIFWVMPRFTKDFAICPIVVVDLGSQEVRKNISRCADNSIMLCELRGKKTFKFCSSICATLTGTITKVCSPGGYWESSKGTCNTLQNTCELLPRLDGSIRLIFNLSTFEHQSEAIRDVLVKKNDALDVVFRTRVELAKNLTALIKGPQEVENKTKKFMNEVMQTAIARVTSKKELSQACIIGREFLTSFGEKLSDNQVVKSGDEQIPESHNLAFAVQKVSLAALTTPVSLDNQDTMRPREYIRSDVAGSWVELSGEFNTSKSLFIMGHIVMDKLPVDVIKPKASENFPEWTV